MPGGVRKPQCYRTACMCVCVGGGGREEGGGGCACAGAVCVYVSDPRGSGVDDGLKALALRPNTVSKET